jgi:FkbM family methyltransferase
MANEESSFLHNLPLTKIKITIAKIMYRFARIVYGKQPRVITRKGIVYEVDLSEGIDLSLFFFGGFQQYVSNNWFYKFPEDAVVIDVGANFGMMSLQFAKATPHGTVYSFEPTHYALSKFKRNLELNPELASHIRVINSFVSAVSDKNPNIKAFSSWKVDGEKSDDMHPVHWGAAKSADGVGSVTLDDFFKQNNLNKIDFIKIDVDGHEFEVLQGARACIGTFKPVVIFEIGLYLLVEKKIEYTFFNDYFTSLNYKLYDAKNRKQVTMENYRKLIPAQGTIDVIALPS